MSQPRQAYNGCTSGNDGVCLYGTCPRLEKTEDEGRHGSEGRVAYAEMRCGTLRVSAGAMTTCAKEYRSCPLVLAAPSPVSVL